mmetsp:Transcript_10161/g.37821  ORF Transcript_10161/g.37821 Transcript_10161/m.37821 type:complete len:91 (-) Transcript_10161:2432-2704(-)
MHLQTAKIKKIGGFTCSESISMSIHSHSALYGMLCKSIQCNLLEECIVSRQKILILFDSVTVSVSHLEPAVAVILQSSCHSSLWSINHQA